MIRVLKVLDFHLAASIKDANQSVNQPRLINFAARLKKAESLSTHWAYSKDYDLSDRSDFMDANADLSHCLGHTPFVFLSYYG